MHLLILACVFNMTPDSMGTTKRHTMTKAEIAHLYTLSDGQDGYDDGVFEGTMRSYQRHLCYKYFHVITNNTIVYSRD